MSRVHKIKIKNGDYSTGELTLSDRGHTKADKTDYVNWYINNSNNNRVAAITNIQIKPNSPHPDIFSIDPHSNGEEWSAEIDHNAPYFADWYYAIHWKGKDGKNYVHDPKISVRPSTALNLFTKVVLTTLALLLGIRLIKFWRKERIKR